MVVSSAIAKSPNLNLCQYFQIYGICHVQYAEYSVSCTYNMSRTVCHVQHVKYSVSCIICHVH